MPHSSQNFLPPPTTTFHLWWNIGPGFATFLGKKVLVGERCYCSNGIFPEVEVSNPFLGRTNPARKPVDMVANIPLFTEFIIHLRWLFGICEPSTVCLWWYSKTWCGVQYLCSLIIDVIYSCYFGGGFSLKPYYCSWEKSQTTSWCGTVNIPLFTGFDTYHIDDTSDVRYKYDIYTKISSTSLASLASCSKTLSVQMNPNGGIVESY